VLPISVDKLSRERFIKEDHEFQALYQKYFSVIFRHVNYLVGGDASAAEDITQETLIKLYASPPVADDYLTAWLLRVSSNLAYNYLKNRKQRELRESKAYFRNMDPTGLCLPEEAVVSHQEVLAVKEVLDQMDERDRLCLLLKFSGFSYTEISQITGVPKTSVGQVLARARDKFKKEFILRHGGNR